MSEEPKIENRNLNNDPLILEGKIPFRMTFNETQFLFDYQNDPTLTLAAMKIVHNELMIGFERKKEMKMEVTPADRQMLIRLNYYLEDLAAFIREKALNMATQGEVRKEIPGLKMVSAMAGLKNEGK